MKYIYRHHLNIINGSLSKALSNIIFFCIREGFKKKKRAEFSALFKKKFSIEKVQKYLEKFQDLADLAAIWISEIF